MRTNRNRWIWIVNWLVLPLGIAVALGACGQISPGGAMGTLTGDVVAGPTCPVEHIDNPCPPRPIANREVLIQVRTSAATPANTPQTVATTKTDTNGHFSVSVPPGDYTVRVAIIPGTIGMRQDMPSDVTVVAGQTAYIKITLDTGIR
jgi:carboxypeptidase family protein